MTWRFAGDERRGACAHPSASVDAWSTTLQPPTLWPPSPDDAYLHPRERRAIVDRWLRGGSVTRSLSFFPLSKSFPITFSSCTHFHGDRGENARCCWLESDAAGGCSYWRVIEKMLFETWFEEGRSSLEVHLRVFL